MKRLRVRLKASGPEELAETFGHRLRTDGVRLPAKGELAPGTGVSVLLLYKSGESALEGTGEVLSCVRSRSGAFDIDMSVRWSPASRDVLSQILPPIAGRRPFDVLTTDLLDEAVGPRPAPANSTADMAQIPRVLSPEDVPDIWSPERSEKLRGEPSSLPPAYEPPTPDIRAETMESGEVTPLARIDLVRGETSSTVERSKAPPVARGRLVIGVDIGTARTRSACVVEGKLQPVPSRRGMDSLPSVVHIDPSGKTIVGEPAARRSTMTPEHGLRDMRRLLGFVHDSVVVRTLAGRYWFQLIPADDYETAVRVGNHQIPVHEVLSLLLKEVRESANLVLPDRVNRGVFTVPGWAGPRQRAAMCRAAEAAGFHVERLVGEAAACAVAYADHDREAQEDVLVISLGAGQLDVVAGRLERGVFSSRAVGGTSALGGVDFDRALTPLLIEAIEDATGERPAETPAFWARVQACAEEVKTGLTEAEQVEAEFHHPMPSGEDFIVRTSVTRAVAEGLWEPLVQACVELVTNTIARSGIERFGRVLWCGGALALPRVQAALQAHHGDVLIEELQPEAPAVGAAILGERLRLGHPLGLTEVLPSSVHLAVEGVGKWKLFDASSLTPSSRRLELPKGGRRGATVLVQGDGAVERQPIGDLELPAGAAADLEISVSEDLRLSATVDGAPVPLGATVDPQSFARWFEALELAPEGATKRPGWLNWLRGR